ncbi:hypothetical protein L7F22_038458 [Adiantum nelumboides]|nr:hypothetical protein [Adiantum nelumboides]
MTAWRRPLSKRAFALIVPHICSTKLVDSKVEVEGEDTGFAWIQGLQRVLCRNFGLINLEELDKNYEKVMEDSEEVRLLLLQLMKSLVHLCSLEMLLAKLECISQVLIVALADPFHEIKKEVSATITLIVERSHEMAPQISENLLKASVPNLKHPHSKTVSPELMVQDSIGPHLEADVILDDWDSTDLDNTEPVVALGLSEPMKDHRRGKKSPLQLSPLSSTSSHSSISPAQPKDKPKLQRPKGGDELPFEELPQGWLQEIYANFKVDQTPAHDVSMPQETAFSPPASTISALPSLELVKEVTSFMHSFKNVFAWNYKDLEGIPPELGVHTIPLVSGAKPVRSRAYKLNPKYHSTTSAIIPPQQQSSHHEDKTITMKTRQAKEVPSEFEVSEEEETQHSDDFEISEYEPASDKESSADEDSNAESSQSRAEVAHTTVTAMVKRPPDAISQTPI